MPRPKPAVLIILDGWGIAPPSRGNAISLARTPVMDKLVRTYPAMTLQASGEAVGLPWGEMGNSEVGHLNIGAGKIVYNDLTRISKSILDGSFFTNTAFQDAATHIGETGGNMHFIGMVGPGGVHSHEEHLYALLECAQQHQAGRCAGKVFIHTILDGRDTPFNSGKNFIVKLLQKIESLQIGKIATLSGRFWAMDRDNNWDRVEKAYRAMVEGKADIYAADPIKAIEASYAKKVYDEEYIPTVMTQADGQPVATIQNGDAVIFFNFRPDRARQLTTALVLPGFEKFQRVLLDRLFMVTMSEYDKGLPVAVAFPSEKIADPLAKVLSDAGFTQLHIAETEKYAHVTYFFNGGSEKAFTGEERVLIPSPHVASYDQKPRMRAEQITDTVVQRIEKEDVDFILLNFANPDMVAHTGNLPATIEAIETVDTCIGRIVDATLQKNGLVCITADHGNAEEVVKLQTGVIDKEHSTFPVPFIVVQAALEGKTAGLPTSVGEDLSMLTPRGLLSDIAPTILKLLNLPKSAEMTGRPLV